MSRQRSSNVRGGLRGAAWCSCVAVWVGGMAFGAANALAAAGDDKPLEAFASLEDDMRAAVSDYHDAHEKAHAGESGNPSTDPNASPKDGRLDVLARMDALVEKAATGPHGGALAVQTLLWALDIDPALAFARFKTLVKRFPNEPTLTDALEYVPYLAGEVGKVDEWSDILVGLSAATNQADLQQRSSLARGRVLLEAGRKTTARKVFDSIVKSGGSSELMEEAKGFVFEIDFLQVGKPAPGFETKTLDGQTLTLQQLRGKVVLLDFWASWCPSCIAEIPHLRGAVKKLEGKPFEIVSVSLDDERRAALGILRSLDAPGIHTWVPAGGENPVATLYNVHGLPTWYLIDKNGIIRARDPFGDKLLPAITEALNAGGAKEGR